MTQETKAESEMNRETTPPPPLTAADPFPGEFRLVRLLGSGAFGEVWLADDLSPLRRQVALKFLRTSGVRHDAGQALAILQNDARLLASLRHPNIVQVHAWRQAPGCSPCLVMHFVPGGSLDGRVREHGPLNWNLAARYVADIADGLLLVHGKGIIHRDVKPANMLHDPETDEALLTDFGIAARLADPLTVAGTPSYMAPEAFRGEVSPALDVYALAASLFWLVTATAPFDGDDVTALCHNIEAGLPVIDPRFAGVPAPLEQLIRAGLAARAGDRPSLGEFVRQLRGALNLLLADCLTQPPGGEGTVVPPVHIRLILSRIDHGRRSSIAWSTRMPEPMLRDLRRVPKAPDSVQLRTGERVRLEVEVDRPGYVTVFNIGPTGNLNLLYPAEPGDAPPMLAAHRRMHLLDLELTPPAGQERLFAVWTRQPLPLRLDELRSLVEEGHTGCAGPYRATRDMARVRQSLEQINPQDRHVVVLELEHVM
jgi:serine/threonine protein kinase